MATTPGAVRPLTLDDLPWVLDLSARRRERLAPFAPRFWRPAPDARARQREFLAPQLQEPRVVSLRTDHGFVIAVPRANRLDVDDMALDQDDRWPEDGARLLRAVLEQGAARVVCPVLEPARRQTAVAAGLEVSESWWHRDLPAPACAAAVEDRVITVRGASGRLVDAPPVYAPGGPVLLAHRVDSGAALAALEQAARAAGAVVSVVPRSPGQPNALLRSAGYVRTTDFFASRQG